MIDTSAVFCIFSSSFQLFLTLIHTFLISDKLDGQTNSGKTHTMLGQGDTRGILEMAIEDIFQQISLQKGEIMDENDKENQNSAQNSKRNSNTDRIFLLKLSFIEIYNEKIYDLLSQNKNVVALREDKKTFCSDTTEIEIYDHHTIIKALKKGKIGRKNI